MPRAQTRATQSTVDKVHRLVGRTLAQRLKAAHDSGEAVSAALLASAISFLKLTETTAPVQPRRKKDTLRGLMPDMNELERGMQVPPKGV